MFKVGDVLITLFSLGKFNDGKVGLKVVFKFESEDGVAVGGKKNSSWLIVVLMVLKFETMLTDGADVSDVVGICTIVTDEDGGKLDVASSLAGLVETGLTFSLQYLF